MAARGMGKLRNAIGALAVVQSASVQGSATQRNNVGGRLCDRSLAAVFFFKHFI